MTVARMSSLDDGVSYPREDPRATDAGSHALMSSPHSQLCGTGEGV